MYVGCGGVHPTAHVWAVWNFNGKKRQRKKKQVVMAAEGGLWKKNEWHKLDAKRVGSL